MGFNRTHGDHASPGTTGVRRVYHDGGPRTSVVWLALILDATVEDALAELPPCAPNAGRLVWAKRIDVPDYFVAELVLDGSDTIQGDGSNYPLANQWSSLLLCATTSGDWLVVSEIA